ncbi:MAG: hypothetical protein FDZ70_07355 [Actinobacteria bacterium]|nr:MAG: hypothetical protein FDZ70_07355 [Actinomycetota bacterium]
MGHMQAWTRRGAIALVAIIVAAVALAGCTSAKTAEEKDPGVWGYVASADSAQLELADKQLGVDQLIVDRVKVPEDAWVVVHLDDNGKPGARVGLTAIPKGESADVRVTLEKVTSPKVIVAIHADRATGGEFDFDMMAKEMSPDRPFFVDGKELAKVAEVREFGVRVNEGTPRIAVEDQPGVRESLVVSLAAAPTDAWIVVHADDDGAPGARVGLAHVTAGESRGVTVALYPVPLTPDLFVALHADRGEAGTFEFDMMDKINSPDQPFFVGQDEVAIKVAVQ